MVTWLRAAAVAALAFASLASPKEAKADGGAAQYRYTTACDSSFGPLNAAGPSTLTYDAHGNACTTTAVTVTASITGFTPTSVGTPIAVTTGGVTGTLPSGTVVVVSNVGTTNTAYCALGASTTANWQPITPNGGWFAYTVGGATQLSCITTASTTTINMVGGTGLPTGTGGGGGGSGGGGGAVTVASGADVTEGTAADAAYAGSGSATVISALKGIYAGVTALPAITGVTIANGADAAEGNTGDVAWVSGGGTVISILKKIASGTGGPVTIASGADATEGTTADVAWVSGSGTVISLLKTIATGTTGVEAVTVANGADVTQGAIADTAWTGTGNATVVAALKGIYTAVVANGGGGGGSSSIVTWAGGTLGAMANFGSNPGAVLSPSMNSYLIGSTSFAVAGAPLPSNLTVVGISDTTLCSGGPCVTPAAALQTGTFGAPSPQVISVQANDPCTYALKSSKAISVASATTTALVPLSGTTVVYACGWSMTIAPSGTAAATALFEYGTGATCGTGTTTLTGTYGNGDLTSAAPVTHVAYGTGGYTVATAPAGNAMCLLTAGTAVSVQGILTYVQQ